MFVGASLVSLSFFTKEDTGFPSSADCSFWSDPLNPDNSSERLRRIYESRIEFAEKRNRLLELDTQYRSLTSS